MATTKKKREKRKESSAKRRAMKHSAGGDRTTVKAPNGIGFMKIKEGIQKFDILGYTAGKGNPYANEGEFHYERTFFMHRGIGPENNSYVCPRKTAGKKCPICEHMAKMDKDRDADPDLVKALAPKERQLFQVINHAEKDKGIQLLEISHHNFGKRLDAEVRDAEDDEGIDEFYQHKAEDGGKTLKVGWVEDSFSGQNFMKADTIKFVDRAKAIDPDILESVVCLDDLIIIPSYDELKKIYMQQDDEDEDDEEDEDEDEDEDDEEDEDEEEEKPRKSKKKSSKSDEDEDDEGDEDEDNDDDEDDEEEEDEGDEDEDDEEDYEGLKKGDRVTGIYKKKKFSGTIAKLAEGMVHVKTEDGDKRVMKADELAKVKKGKPKDEEDEDEEEDEDDEGEEDEEEKPSKKKSKSSKTSSKKASDEDDDEEDEDDDMNLEDEEDEDEDDDED